MAQTSWLPASHAGLARWIQVVCGLLVCVAIAAPGSASAHVSVVRSEPADGASAAKAPQTIRIWFDEAFVPAFSTVRVIDVRGQDVQPVVVTRDEADDSLMIVQVPALAAGVYNVVFKVLAEDDGHFTQGHLVFGIGAGSSALPALAAAPATQPALAEVVLRWLDLIGLAALVGAVVVWQLIVARAIRRTADPATRSGLARAQRRIVVWAAVCAAAAFLVGFGLLAWQFLAVAPDGLTWTVAARTGWDLLFGVRWGAFWLARQGLLVGAAALLLMITRRLRHEKSVPIWAAALLDVTLLGLLVNLATSGHAAALAVNPLPAIAAVVLHMVAASIWIGGLMALGIGLLPLVRHSRENVRRTGQGAFDQQMSLAPVQRTHGNAPGQPEAGWSEGGAQDAGDPPAWAVARACLVPFGQVAAVSVALLAATGIYSMGRQVASLDALISSPYGAALLAKTGLLLVAGLIGLINSALLHPRVAAPLGMVLRRPPGWTPLSLQRMPVLIVTELGLGALIFLATGLLTSLPPARGPEFAPAPQLPSMLSQVADDLLVTIATGPNRPGVNLMTLRIVSSRRPNPAPITSVAVAFTPVTTNPQRVENAAVPIEPGVYQVGGDYFNRDGPWQVDVTVQRPGMPDSQVRFYWTVGPVIAPRAVLISNYPWESLLTVLILMLTLLGLCGNLLRHRLARIAPRLSAARHSPSTVLARPASSTGDATDF